MSIIERQDEQETPSLLFVETLGEVRIKSCEQRQDDALCFSEHEVTRLGGCESGMPFGASKWTLAKRSKGARRMPRRGQARKDVASCEKPWGGARYL